MKRTILMTGAVLLLFNTLIGLIISFYPLFNCLPNFCIFPLTP